MTLITPPKVNAQLIPIDCGQTGSVRHTAWGQERHSLIYSENHRKTTKFDSGGPFFVEHYLNQVEQDSKTYTYKFNGVASQAVRFVAASPQVGLVPSFPVYPSYSAEQSLLKSKGSTGYRRARPGNPVANAGQWIAELRDLPTLPLRQFLKLRNFASLGSEYLNVQFGWKPFVDDLRKMVETYQRMDKLITQLKRDNGRSVRRRRTISDTTDTTATTTNYPTTWGAFWPSPSTIIGETYQSQMTVQTVTKEKIWFVGRFRYYIPDIESSQWNRRAQLALFGANPTPSLLWEVMPWTWLVGYFSNVGDVISNLSTNAVDNLVSEYAYVMRTKSVQTTWMSTGIINGGKFGAYEATSGQFAARTTKLTLTKSRARATPYGFGVDFGSLSDYQRGILAALGISRSRF